MWTYKKIELDEADLIELAAAIANNKSDYDTRSNVHIHIDEVDSRRIVAVMN